MTAPPELRHHLLTGVVVRVARSPERAAFVLRGGMLTRAWLGERARATRDLDYVGAFAFDRDATHARFARALATATDDGIAIDRGSLQAEAMWTDTGFPGVRLGFAIGVGVADQRVSIDVGFNDPVVPPAIEVAIANTPVCAVRPETQLAWKLHGLAEMGASFRPKDLADLFLLVTHVPLAVEDVARAIVPAFVSRAFALTAAAATLAAPHWTTKTSQARWEPYRRLGELAATLTYVRAYLDPILEMLDDQA